MLLGSGREHLIGDSFLTIVCAFSVACHVKRREAWVGRMLPKFTNGNSSCDQFSWELLKKQEREYQKFSRKLPAALPIIGRGQFEVTQLSLLSLLFFVVLYSSPCPPFYLLAPLIFLLLLSLECSVLLYKYLY